MISKATIAQILDVARIEEVVGDYVTLKKRGVNMIGLCPFHNEKTPSFTVSPNKGIYKCFGCGKAGNSVNFLMEHEHFTYPESLRFLAAKYHIPLEETEDSQQAKEDEKLAESLYIINKFAVEYYTKTLNETDEGKSIGLSYFKERGFRKDIIERFELGYALDSYDAFNKEALAKGYQKELLLKAGLISEKERGVFDFFRGRVIFPIHNLSGKVVAFAGRILKKDAKAPKYVNSPETEIYFKSKTLYGMQLARNSIRVKDECLLVEGYIDVITMHQAGFENVVASSGTSLTVEQVRLIKRFTPNITILYDGDNAGIKAAIRGLEIALAEGLNVKICLIPDGDDPDSYLMKHGSSAMQALLMNEAKNFLYFQAEWLLKDAGNDPVKKAAAANDVIKSISLVDDPIKRTLYTQDLAHIIGIKEDVLIRQVNKIKRTHIQKTMDMPQQDAEQLQQFVAPDEFNSTQREATDNISLMERDIIRLLIEFGDKDYDKEQTAATYIAKQMEGFEWSDATSKAIFDEFAEGITKQQLPTHHELMGRDNEDVKNAVKDIVTEKYQLSPNWEKMHEIYTLTKEQNYKNDINNVLNRFKLNRVEELIMENNRELKEAELQGKNEKVIECIQTKIHLDNYRKELARISGTNVTGFDRK